MDWIGEPKEKEEEVMIDNPPVYPKKAHISTRTTKEGLVLSSGHTGILLRDHIAINAKKEDYADYKYQNDATYAEARYRYANQMLKARQEVSLDE